MPSQTQRALVLVFNDIEEIEALTPVDILRRAEIDVTIASVCGSSSVTGRNGITFSVDKALSGLAGEKFDLVVLPGGPGVTALIGNEPVADVLKKHDTAGADVAAICAAPKILAHIGLLENKVATSHIAVRGDLPHPSDDPVVVDGNITTSQGLGTAVDFALALVRKLKGATVADEIAASIHR